MAVSGIGLDWNAILADGQAGLLDDSDAGDVSPEASIYMPAVQQPRKYWWQPGYETDENDFVIMSESEATFRASTGKKRPWELSAAGARQQRLHADPSPPPANKKSKKQPAGKEAREPPLFKVPVDPKPKARQQKKTAQSKKSSPAPKKPAVAKDASHRPKKGAKRKPLLMYESDFEDEMSEEDTFEDSAESINLSMAKPKRQRKQTQKARELEVSIREKAKRILEKNPRVLSSIENISRADKAVKKQAGALSSRSRPISADRASIDSLMSEAIIRPNISAAPKPAASSHVPPAPEVAPVRVRPPAVPAGKKASAAEKAPTAEVASAAADPMRPVLGKRWAVPAKAAKSSKAAAAEAEKLQPQATFPSPSEEITDVSVTSPVVRAGGKRKQTRRLIESDDSSAESETEEPVQPRVKSQRAAANRACKTLTFSSEMNSTFASEISVMEDSSREWSSNITLTPAPPKVTKDTATKCAESVSRNAKAAKSAPMNTKGSKGVPRVEENCTLPPSGPAAKKTAKAGQASVREGTKNGPASAKDVSEAETIPTSIKDVLESGVISAKDVVKGKAASTKDRAKAATTSANDMPESGVISAKNAVQGRSTSANDRAKAAPTSAKDMPESGAISAKNAVKGKAARTNDRAKAATTSANDMPESGVISAKNAVQGRSTSANDRAKPAPTSAKDMPESGVISAEEAVKGKAASTNDRAKVAPTSAKDMPESGVISAKEAVKGKAASTNDRAKVAPTSAKDMPESGVISAKDAVKGRPPSAEDMPEARGTSVSDTGKECPTSANGGAKTGSTSANGGAKATTSAKGGTKAKQTSAKGGAKTKQTSAKAAPKAGPTAERATNDGPASKDAPRAAEHVPAPTETSKSGSVRTENGNSKKIDSTSVSHGMTPGDDASSATAPATQPASSGPAPAQDDHVFAVPLAPAPTRKVGGRPRKTAAKTTGQAAREKDRVTPAALTTSRGRRARRGASPSGRGSSCSSTESDTNSVGSLDEVGSVGSGSVDFDSSFVRRSARIRGGSRARDDLNGSVFVPRDAESPPPRGTGRAVSVLVGVEGVLRRSSRRKVTHPKTEPIVDVLETASETESDSGSVADPVRAGPEEPAAAVNPVPRKPAAKPAVDPVSRKPAAKPAVDPVSRKPAAKPAVDPVPRKPAAKPAAKKPAKPPTTSSTLPPPTVEDVADSPPSTRASSSSTAAVASKAAAVVPEARALQRPESSDAAPSAGTVAIPQVPDLMTLMTQPQIPANAAPLVGVAAGRQWLCEEEGAAGDSCSYTRLYQSQWEMSCILRIPPNGGVKRDSNTVFTIMHGLVIAGHGELVVNNASQRLGLHSNFTIPHCTVYRIVNVHEEEMLIHAVQRRLMPHEMQYPPLAVLQQ